MFDLSTMDRISVKDSIYFIGYNMIVCLHGCVHTKNVIGRTIAFKRCQIYFNDFVRRLGAVGLVCCSIVLHSCFYIVCCSPVFMPFCRNMSGHALMGRPSSRMETMALVFSSYVVVCIVDKRRWLSLYVCYFLIYVIRRPCSLGVSLTTNRTLFNVWFHVWT